MSRAKPPTDSARPHPAASPHIEHIRRSANEPDSHSWQHLLSPHILVVDDESFIRQILLALLSDEGYQVTDVATGQEALQVLKSTNVQLLLTDLKLPDMDGITLMEQVIDADPKISGIVMTGYGTIDLAIRAIRAGAAEFLTKPLQPEVVLLTVQRQLKIQLLRQENALLKKAMLKSGGIRVRAFQPGELDPEGPGGTARTGGQYERGLAEGERRAQSAASAARAKEQAFVANAMRELERTTRMQLEQIEAEAAALAFEIASKVVHEAAKDKRELVVTQAREAVARVRVRGQEEGFVQISVHPNDAPLLDNVREELARSPEAPVVLKITSDASISPGGCRVETAIRIVDATLEAQLARLGEALRRRIGRGPL